jgi:hypothetical protein
LVGAPCRFGFSRRVDAASARRASLRAEVAAQSSEQGATQQLKATQQLNMMLLRQLLRRRARRILVRSRCDEATQPVFVSLQRLLCSWPVCRLGGKMKAPPSESQVLLLWPKYMVRTLDQQASEVDVACFYDAQLSISSAGLTIPPSQAEIAAHIATVPIGVSGAPKEAIRVPSFNNLRQNAGLSRHRSRVWVRLSRHNAHENRGFMAQ